MRTRLQAMIAVSLACCPNVLCGQGPPPRMPVDSGTLIRLAPPTGPYVVGRLLRRIASRQDSAVMCRYPGPPCTSVLDPSEVRRMLLTGTTTIEVQRGNHLATGAIIGGLIGGALGAGVGGFRSLCDAVDCGPSANTVTMIGALAGAVLGGAFGASSPSWAKVPRQ